MMERKGRRREITFWGEVAVLDTKPRPNAFEEDAP